MSEFKGGRGKRAPYSTEHYRIPTPLKGAITAICNRYRQLVDNYNNPQESELIDLAITDTPQEGKNNELENAYKLIDELQQENKYLKKYLADKVSFLEKVIQSNYQLKLKQEEILTQALSLKANAGGAIKREIEKAIALGKISD